MTDKKQATQKGAKRINVSEQTARRLLVYVAEAGLGTKDWSINAAMNELRRASRNYARSQKAKAHSDR